MTFLVVHTNLFQEGETRGPSTVDKCKKTTIFALAVL